MKNNTCSVCHKEIYSGISKGCKLCGMALEDEGKEFCCRTCRTKYDNIHKK